MNDPNTERTLRGGSTWSWQSFRLSAAYRIKGNPHGQDDNSTGFRVALSCRQVAPRRTDDPAEQRPER